MALPDCYKTNHTSSLIKISGRLQESREFIFAYDLELPISDNLDLAYRNRWYGNISQANCNRITRHFNNRFILDQNNFKNLRRYLTISESRDFPWINHFYMLLDDIYYRWATSDFLAARYNNGLLEVPRTRFNAELKEQLPETVSDGGVSRYARNLLTAIRDNGLLEGHSNKAIVSPQIQVNTLAFMLYTLAQWGEGGSDFDESPLFLSLLKPKELLVPLFLEGERLGYWDFTGDREKLRFNLNYSDLGQWLDEVK